MPNRLIRFARYEKAAIFTARTGLLFPVIAGLLFFIIGRLGYSTWNENDYQVRDDGVITLSHGRNLAEYGTISPNPSGERVEGYSAPVQMGLYFIFYKISAVSYDTFSNVQTNVSLFFLGFIFFLFLKERPWLALAASGGSAIFLTQCHSFLGWHGSGMENPVTHVLFLWALYLIFKMFRSGEIRLWYALVLFLASISRVESIWHFGPIIMVFTICWYLRYRTGSAFWVVLIFIGLWGAFQGWRYFYFGALMPNTGIAQSIDVWERLSLIAELDRAMIDESARHAVLLFAKHNAYLFLFALPLLMFARKDSGKFFILFLVLVFLVMAFFSPFVFGRARFDDARTTTHLPIMVALGISFIVMSIEKKITVLWALPLLLVIFFLEMQVHGNQRKYLCCDVPRFDKVRLEFDKLQIKHDLFRPTVANSDLGILSWHKQFNIVDLGFLGSPVVAHLRHEPKVLTDYFLEFAAPDFVEMHGFWSCKHHHIQEDKRFNEIYKPVRSKRDSFLKRKCRTHNKVKTGVWVRKDIMKGAETRERALIDVLSKQIDPAFIEREIKWCSAQDDPTACLYVTRTIYRFLPELDRGDHLDAIKKQLGITNIASYSRALLESPNKGLWHRSVVDNVRRFTNLKERSSKLK